MDTKQNVILFPDEGERALARLRKACDAVKLARADNDEVGELLAMCELDEAWANITRLRK